MKYSRSYEDLIDIVKNSISISEILKKLGLRPSGSNYKTMYRYFALYSIDTSHLLGRSSTKGTIRHKLRKPTSDILVKDEIVHVKTSIIKKRLIEENILIYACSECGISNWNNKELSLHLDHINGDSFDNRKENLRFLCPNCHSQTDTYCGKKNRQQKKLKQCTCGSLINIKSTVCKKCRKQKSKIDWSNMQAIIQLVKDTSFEKAAKILNVSSTAIRKHIKKSKIDITVDPEGLEPSTLRLRV